MGIKLGITIIDTKGKRFKVENELKFPHKKVKTEDLCPNYLHIGFFKNKIILLNEHVNELISEDKNLNHIENLITNEIPKSEIVHIVQFDSINLAGYVIIENGQKFRAKCVANEQIYLDDDNLTDFEIQTLETTKNSIFEAHPQIKDKILKTISGKTKKEELIYFLTFRNKLIKDNITYYNGNFEIQFINMIIPYLVESDWFGLTKIQYVKYNKVKLNQPELEIMKYINHAFNQLK